MDRLRTTERILSEDALKHIYKCEQKGNHPTIQSIAGSLQITLDKAADIMTNMMVHELLSLREGEIYLSEAGRNYALQIIRAHRLWERYLADETGFTEAEWHDQAERREHELTPSETEALAARLGYPTHDPHGDPIPTAEGELVSHGGQPLTAIAPGCSVRIVHLEDEPEMVYAQLVAEELSPGMEIYMRESSPQAIRFWANGREHALAPVIAANISVVPIPKSQASEPMPGLRLSDLEAGQKGRVVSISPACRGPERRRFMDLGILPGTTIIAEMKSPGGDPIAYRIRGALIALRLEQAVLININRVEESL